MEPLKPTARPLLVGREEWLSLPELGLPALCAKVDTGARTSALHAFDIERLETETGPRLRFTVHPIPGRTDLAVAAEAPLADQRLVTSSNGESELRYVVRTPLTLGGRTVEAEISLTNREALSTRMLLGRQALEALGAVVDPTRSRRLKPLDYSPYVAPREAREGERPLSIALLTMNAGNYSSRRLIEAARTRGHRIDPIDTTRCYMDINVRSPAVLYDGRVLPRYDAVIPRIGTPLTDYGLAVVRQFEMTGAYCLNSAGAISAARDKLHALQVLARKGVAMPVTAFARSPKDTAHVISLVGGAPLVVKLLQGSQGRGVVLTETAQAAESVISAFRDLDADILVQEFVAEAKGADIRCLVIGSTVVAAMKRQAREGEFRSNLHQGGEAMPVRITAAERDLAVRAVRALGLQVAGVDILRASDGPKVIEVNSSPGLQGVERASGKDVAGRIIERVERKLRPWPPRRSTEPTIDREP